MKRIIFVDDEPAILQGLRNALRRRRTHWDMVFVDSGPAALREMERGAFDVVISDMRMPQMDGAQLLSRVRSEHPQTARVVLSGHSDQEALLRVLPTAHQLLAKPSTPEQLEQVIERTCGLQSLLHSESVRRLASGLDRLPSSQQTYRALIAALARPDAQVDTIATMIEGDPAICLKLLQLVNSGYFGLERHVKSVRHAVGFLGLDLVKGLALSAHVYSAADQAQCGGQCVEAVQDHSVRTARLARRLIGDSRAADEAFTTALLHDIGKIVMAVAASADYREVSECVARTHEPGHQAEQRILGASHAEVGAYLMGICGLPVSMVESVAYHHRPAMAGKPSRLAAALHVANAFGEIEGAAGPDIDLAFLDTCGISGELEQWRRIAAEHLDAPKRARLTLD